MALLTLKEAEDLAAAALRRCDTSEANAALVAKARLRPWRNNLAILVA